MTDIAEWLADLGLEEYAKVFADNGVEVDILGELSDDDLKELGVKLGHRRRILKAIRDDRVAATTRAPATGATGSTAERRQITVMFCDLVGSTALSEALDPEDLRTLMAAYQKAAGAVVDRYAGHVAQYLGDGLMVYFGWPQAHEDDAGRAVRAGLDVIEAVKQVASPMPLQVRIGIATGPVVVGETGAGDASVPKAAVGETPNVAARVQGLAGPDTVVISDSTRRLVGGGFELESLGAQSLKGVAEPLEVFRVHDTRATSSRFAASHGGGLTPMVGRDSELSLILDRWQLAKSGEGQVVLISGEPGIGKSRLVEAVAERLADEPHIDMRYQCFPYYANTAFYPITSNFAQAAGFAAGDTAEVKLGKLEAIIEQIGLPTADIAPLFANALSIPTGDRYPPLDGSPERVKQRTIAALTDRFIAATHAEPVLFVVEDLQWIDPSSLESVNRIIDIIVDIRALAVLTHRPDFTPPWLGQGHVTSLTLNRFGRRQAADLIEGIAGLADLPAVVRGEIIAKTDGVPLFVEEVTKMLLDAGAAGEQPGHGAGPTAVTIPATLQDSLMARLDLLGPGKEVAQIGACIGREFSHALIEAVAADHPGLDEALAQLTDAELLFRHGDPPDATYSFKHSLVQETAYQSLLRSRRQTIHGRIAAVLTERFPEIVAAEPERLARHLTEAGRAADAIDLWARAADAAIGRAANSEAIAHLSRALDALDSMPDETQRLRRELEFRTTMGPALLATTGWTSTAVGDNYLRARELCDTVGDPHDRFKAMWGIWLFRASRGEMAEANALVRGMLDLAERQNDPAWILEAHHAGWGGQIWLGELEATAAHIETGLPLYDPVAHRGHAGLYGGHDPAVCGRGLNGLRLWMQGYPDQALENSRISIDIARSIDHTPSITHALFYAAVVSFFRGDVDAVDRQITEVMALAEDHPLPLYQSMAKGFLGWIMVQRDNRQTGLEVIRTGVTELEAIGAKMTAPMMMVLAADVAAQGESVDDAMATLDAAQQTIDDTGELLWQSEVHRVRGDVTARAGGDPEPLYHQAVAAARQIGAGAMELRAVTALGRMYQARNDGPRARELLAPAFRSFTEGHETADLKIAEAVLAEIG